MASQGDAQENPWTVGGVGPPLAQGLEDRLARQFLAENCGHATRVGSQVSEPRVTVVMKTFVPSQMRPMGTLIITSAAPMTVVVAGAFLVSVPAGRPLAGRLAEDFLPMPEAFRSHPAVRRYFIRITLLWALVQLSNAALGFWLLVSQPVPVFLAAKTAGTLFLTALAIGVSAYVFFRSMRFHGLLPARARVAVARPVAQ